MVPFIIALALAITVGLIDYLTGDEISFDPFYSIPILLIVWFGNRNLAIVISIFCALAWWWADSAVGHRYSSEWVRIWDVIVRLMFFCLVMFAGSVFKQQRDSNRARIELLEKSQQLEREIVDISEREQQRIGRDLHDGICQYLAAIGFSAAMLSRDLERESFIGAKRAGGILEGGPTWRFATYRREWRPIAGMAATAAMRITRIRPMPGRIPGSS